MRKNSFFKGLASIVGGTALSLAAGCDWNKPVNYAPKITLSEADSTIVNPSIGIIENPECDNIYLLSLPRGNTLNEENEFHVNIKDKNKNDTIESSAYAVNNQNNPFNVEIIQGSSDQGGNNVNWDIRIGADENVPLGTYEIARVSGTDGYNTIVACIYMSTVPGTTFPPGEIPQIDDENNEPPSPGSDLENLANWACTHIPRPAGNDLALYMVSGTSNNYSHGEPSAEMDPHLEGGQLHYSFSIPQGSNGVVVEGNDNEGTYGERFRIESSSANGKLRSSVGYTSNSCPHVVVIPYGTPDQVFTIMSEPQ